MQSDACGPLHVCAGACATHTHTLLLPPLPAGAACNALMVVWQALACFVLPSALVYASEKRSRRIFLETVSD